MNPDVRIGIAEIASLYKKVRALNPLVVYGCTLKDLDTTYLNPDSRPSVGTIKYKRSSV